MSLNHSPSIVTKDLVLYTDMANTEKSWKGAPATNLLTYSEDFSNAAWNGNLFGNWINAVVTTNNVVDPKETLTADTLTGNYGKFTNSITATVSTAYTFSCWVKNISLVNALYFHIAFGLNGTLVQYNNVLSIPVSSIGDWTRYSLTVTSPASGINQVQAGIEFGGSKTSGGTFAVAAWGAQLEVGSFATPYIPTTTVAVTRSNTQAVVDLTNSNTLTATSLVYASDNTFSFNGSSSGVQSQSTTISFAGGVTMEAVFKSTDLASRAQGILDFVGAGSQGASNYINIYLSGNGKIRWEVIANYPNGNTALTNYYSVATLANNTWYHVCFTQTTTGAAVIYINGISDATATFTSPLSGTITSNIRIGLYGGYFSGSIPVAKMYNRALSAKEVNQNFNALRGRYSI